MKCHYIYDKKAGKVLIPGCEGVAWNYPDMFYCTCRTTHDTYESFERSKYNESIAAKNKLIHELEKENASLNRIIKRLLTPQ